MFSWRICLRFVSSSLFQSEGKSRTLSRAKELRPYLCFNTFRNFNRSLNEKWFYIQPTDLEIWIKIYLGYRKLRWYSVTVRKTSNRIRETASKFEKEIGITYSQILHRKRSFQWYPDKSDWANWTWNIDENVKKQEWKNSEQKFSSALTLGYSVLSISRLHDAF